MRGQARVGAEVRWGALLENTRGPLAGAQEQNWPRAPSELAAWPLPRASEEGGSKEKTPGAFVSPLLPGFPGAGHRGGPRGWTPPHSSSHLAGRTLPRFVLLTFCC